MKKSLALLLALLCAVGCFAAGASAATLPQNQTVAAAMEGIGAAVGTDTAGAAVVLIEGESTLMLEGFGYADLSAKRLITPQTVFEIGQLSSLFVALSAYDLAEQGRLLLTADIRQYLPEQVAAKLALSHPVTVEQLLLGSAGFEGRTFDLRFTDDDYRFADLEQALLAQVPRQIAAPGSFYADSPFSVALVAYVIESITGVSYETYATERILKPLGLTDTVLNPTAETAPADVALGHIKREAGQFSVAAAGGRSYAGLYPADGALSSARDLARVMEFLLHGNVALLSEASRLSLLQSRFGKGLFTLSAPALSVRGNAMGRETETPCFGASLWLDVASERAALVLTNTAASSLVDLPAQLVGATLGVTAATGGELPKLDTFTGFFAKADSEDQSFVGRLLRKEHNVEAEAGEDGVLTLAGRRLVQIAPCVFAAADDLSKTAVVQFLLNADGEVEQVITAAGDTYLPVGFLEHGTVAELLFGLLIVSSLICLAAAAFALIRYLATRWERRRIYDDDELEDWEWERRREPRREPRGMRFVYVLPFLVIGLMSLCTLLQILVGIQYGAAAFYSFFSAMSVITMLLCVAAVAALVLAFAASLTRRGMPGRVILGSVLFLCYVLLLCGCGIMSL